jgi:hypothetical protein
MYADAQDFRIAIGCQQSVVSNQQN